MPLLLTADANPGTAEWSTSDVALVIVAGGTAIVTVAGALPYVDVAVGAAYDGLPVLATSNTADDTFVGVRFAEWQGGGVLRIGGAAVPGTDITVTFAVLNTLL